MFPSQLIQDIFLIFSVAASIATQVIFLICFFEMLRQFIHHRSQVRPLIIEFDFLIELSVPKWRHCEKVEGKVIG